MPAPEATCATSHMAQANLGATQALTASVGDRRIAGTSSLALAQTRSSATLVRTGKLTATKDTWTTTLRTSTPMTTSTDKIRREVLKIRGHHTAANIQPQNIRCPKYWKHTYRGHNSRPGMLQTSGSAPKRRTSKRTMKQTRNCTIIWDTNT